MPKATAAALLASAAPRSEHDPDLEAAAPAAIAMHPVTGAFADPAHESAFAAQFFRLAFPCHMLLIALNLAVFTWAALVTQPGMGAFWSLIGLAVAFLMLSRVLVHCIVDAVRGQRLGSQSWTALIVISWVGGVSMYMMDTAAACATAQVNYLGPLIALVAALVNGSHGMGFAHKLGLMGLLLALDLLLATVCFEFALALALGDVGAHMVGFVVAHMVEMHLRQIYADNEEKVQDQRRLTEERRQLEERNEQLQAEKERLMYDVQRRGRPLDDGDDRSAIRRGLQAGPSQQPPTSDGDTTSSDRSGVKPPPDSAPPSLPPGPPSSTSSGSTAPPLYIWAKPTAPPPTAVELVARHVEQEVAHALLFCARGQTSHQCQSAGVAGAACSGVAATAIVPSAASDGVPTPEQALLIARRDILVAEDQIHVHRVIRTLGLALGATRMEAGTIRALHAVLLQQARPGMNDMEAYRSTGASRSNFSKWRRRVQHILSEGGGSAALAPPPRVSPRCFDS